MPEQDCYSERSKHNDRYNSEYQIGVFSQSLKRTTPNAWLLSRIKSTAFFIDALMQSVLRI